VLFRAFQGAVNVDERTAPSQRRARDLWFGLSRWVDLCHCLRVGPGSCVETVTLAFFQSRKPESPKNLALTAGLSCSVLLAAPLNSAETTAEESRHRL
jgi:hypothetical protein